MTENVVISAAGNSETSALACLRSLGYAVERASSGLFSATNEQVRLNAPDCLALLGLVKLFEMRQAHWQPTDVEVGLAVELNSVHSEQYFERVDARSIDGAIHVICVTSFGDPVEMTKDEAAEFSSCLSSAISEAS